jgi:hypothetical protein
MASEGPWELRLIADASAGVLLDHSDVLVTVYTILYDMRGGVHICSRLLVSLSSVGEGSTWSPPNTSLRSTAWQRTVFRCLSLCDQSECLEWSHAVVANSFLPSFLGLCRSKMLLSDSSLKTGCFFLFIRLLTRLRALEPWNLLPAEWTGVRTIIGFTRNSPAL